MIVQLLAIVKVLALPVRHVPLLVCGGESLMVRGNVPLQGEPEGVVGDNEVQARVKASPSPHMLT